MEKNELLAGLTRALEVARKREAYVEREVMPLYNKLMSKAESAEEVNLFHRIVFSAIPGGINLLALFMASLGETDSTWTKFWGAVWVISGIVVFVVNLYARQIYPKTKLYSNKIDKLLQEEQEMIALFSPGLKKIDEEGMKTFPQLGYKYHSVDALSRMISYVRSGRADSVKEMIEAYELDCHRERIEGKQDRLMWQLDEQQGEINHLSSQLNYVTYYKK